MRPSRLGQTAIKPLAKSNRRTIVSACVRHLEILHRSDALAWAVALCLAACAQGYTSITEHTIDPPIEPEAPQFFGEACSLGDRRECACKNRAGMGIQVCTADETSPTKAAYGKECLPCSVLTAHSELDAGGDDAGEHEVDAGESGRENTTGAMSSSMATAGRSSAAGGSGGAGGRAGAGGAAFGGKGGSGGTGGAAGAAGRPGTTSGQCKCNQSCAPIGISACCRDDGSCGCSWAPGAYCL
jgi:uncharacterized membrane protein YgcG